MARSSPTLRLEQLGRNEQAAVRTLLDAFRDRGWRDQAGTALKTVRALATARHGLSTTRLAAAVPDVFLSANSVSRSNLRDVLNELASRKHAATP